MDIIEQHRKFHQSEDIDLTITQAIRSKNLESIKNVLLINTYSFLNQDEKEEVVFKAIYYDYARNITDDSFLKYLIFEYNIKENNSIKNISNLNNNVKNMFESRKLNEDLNQELNNDNKTGKKLKV
jgi:hypothetical protein